jgi:hypothetical protein
MLGAVYPGILTAAFASYPGMRLMEQTRGLLSRPQFAGILGWNQLPLDIVSKRFTLQAIPRSSAFTDASLKLQLIREMSLNF